MRKTIRGLREERGWTQFQLAVQVDVQPTTVSLWERGKTLPKVTQLRKLADVFGVKMDDIELVEESEGKLAA